MRNVVIQDDHDEVDLKPPHLLQKYLELSEQDVATILVAPGGLQSVHCPGCESAKATQAFERFGLRYQECPRCRTLYVSPRPNDTALTEYYRNSRARKFWHEELARKTSVDRARRITTPRLDWVLESTQEYLPAAKLLVDVNTTSPEMLRALAAAGAFESIVEVDPLVRITEEASVVVTKAGPLSALALDQPVDVVTLFEVADRTSNVESLFAEVHSLLRDSGLCFVTAVLASGFDVQILREQLQTLIPPDRLNVLSVEGIEALAARNGFEVLEFSTPGILDVEIVAASERKGVDLPRFTAYLIGREDESIRRNFQEFLQANRLSSYGRILLRKR